MPAAPTRIALTEAAPEVVEDEAAEVAEPPAVVAAEVLVVPVPLLVVATVPVGAAALVATVGPEEIDVTLVHVVEEPGFTVKGADCAVKPVLSRRVRPIDVPDAMLQTQVTEVLFCCPKFSRATPLGVAPGRMLKK